MKRWPTRPIGDVCDLVNGRAFKPNDWEQAGVPIIRIQNLNDATKPFNYTTQALPEKFKVKPGDTLLSWSGTPGTSFGCFRWDGPEGWLNQHIFNVRLREEVLPSFFIYQVNSKLHELIAKAHGGVGLQHITKGALSSVSVTVPPLAEQERIVALLDEGDALRKLRAQADRRTAHLLPALFHEMFGEIQTQTFERLRLEQIAEVISGVAKGRKFNGRQPIEVPYLRVANVQDGHLDLAEIKTIQALPEEVEELALRKGDVLLTEGGDYDKLGRGAMVEQDLPNCIHQNHVFRVRVNQATLKPIFLAKYLMTAEAKGYFLGCAKRTTNLASINMRQLRALPVPVPPLPLQQEFAQRVAEIRELEAAQAASRLRLEALFQSVLHRAFEGEL
jgi:type I restriction enzyme S subunit